MRKRYKNKRSCPICKPHKTQHSKRWKAQELQALATFERMKIYELLGN